MTALSIVSVVSVVSVVSTVSTAFFPLPPLFAAVSSAGIGVEAAAAFLPLLGLTEDPASVVSSAGAGVEATFLPLLDLTGDSASVSVLSAACLPLLARGAGLS